MAASLLLFTISLCVGFASKDLFAREGDSVELSCRTPRRLGPEEWLIWEHLGLQAKVTRRLFEVSHNQTRSGGAHTERLSLLPNRSLLIAHVQVGDAGTYQCWGFNQSSSSYDLAVLAGRKHTRGCLMLSCSLWSNTVHLGEDGMEWRDSRGALKNGKQSGYSIYQQGQHSQLQIYQVEHVETPLLFWCALKQPKAMEYSFQVTEAEISDLCEAGSAALIRNWDLLKVVFASCATVELCVIISLVVALLTQKEQETEKPTHTPSDGEKGADTSKEQLLNSGFAAPAGQPASPRPSGDAPSLDFSSHGSSQKPLQDLKSDWNFGVYENMLPQRLQLSLKDKDLTKPSRDLDSYIYNEA
ncbi:hypothetical protein NDU88_000868 [Pleurodeles waltl]|uniref:Ig-like domain-containing protein n=1 Tax=Pleurodeles waltl TaxID=8319 RepID=A0AAV7Q211_PLEWA|nr:hypothetical protein NDU88_000868 [Pleurodeles waltl]